MITIGNSEKAEDEQLLEKLLNQEDSDLPIKNARGVGVKDIGWLVNLSELTDQMVYEQELISHFKKTGLKPVEAFINFAALEEIMHCYGIEHEDVNYPTPSGLSYKYKMRFWIADKILKYIE